MTETTRTTPTFCIQNIATQAVIATRTTLAAIILDLVALRVTLTDQISVIDPDGFIVPQAVIAPIAGRLLTQIVSNL